MLLLASDVRHVRAIVSARVLLVLARVASFLLLLWRRRSGETSSIVLSINTTPLLFSCSAVKSRICWWDQESRTGFLHTRFPEGYGGHRTRKVEFVSDSMYVMYDSPVG